MPAITLERDGPVALLTLDRPERMNPLGEDGDGDVIQVTCAAINADPALRVVLLTGAGRAFSAGGDIKAMRDRTGAFGGSGIEIQAQYRSNIHRAARAIHGLELPVVAAVNGPAIGLGCDIACLADMRIAAEGAMFGVTFLKVGLIPGDGGAWLLPRIIGPSRAAEMLFTGEVIDTATALAWGLVDRVVAGNMLRAEARVLCDRIAAQPRQALRMAKLLLRQGASASYESVMELSAAAQALMHQTDDHIEGVTALLERRTPCFQGR